MTDEAYMYEIFLIDMNVNIIYQLYKRMNNCQNSKRAPTEGIEPSTTRLKV